MAETTAPSVETLTPSTAQSQQPPVPPRQQFLGPGTPFATTNDGLMAMQQLPADEEPPPGVQTPAEGFPNQTPARLSVARRHMKKINHSCLNFFAHYNRIPRDEQKRR